MLWRRVQDERPNCSTSGGQSAGGWREEVACAGGVVVEMVAGVVVSFFAICAHAPKDVQERHLH